MPKQIIFDVIPRNNQPPSRLPERKAVSVRKAPEASLPPAAPQKPRPRIAPEPIVAKPRRPRGKFRRYLILALIILGGAFAGLTYFSTATVTVTAKTQTGALSENLSSSKDKGGDIPYTLMTVTRTAASTVTAATDQDVQQKASGSITIYNDFSAAPYRLIKNTRFETPGGLIFKIADTAVVPGKAVAAGKDVPGSITVQVFAESPGAEYNVGLADFTVPGFKGRPEYEGFYAHSKTPIAGGFIGKQKVASDKDIAAARTALDAALRKQVLDAAAAEVPANFALFDAASAISYSSADPAPQDSGVRVTETATLRAAIFDQAALEKLIAGKLKLPDSSVPAAIVNPESLSFAPTETFAAALQAGGPIRFVLSGTPVIRSTIDESALVKALAGVSRSGFDKAIEAFPAIDTAELSLFPAWKRSLPSDASKIRIIAAGQQ